MRKSDRRAQYEKKHQKGGDGKNEKEKSTPKTHLSRKQLERKAREINATNRSIKTVSEIVIEHNEEDILLNLIAQLQNVRLVERIEDLPTITSKEEENEGTNSDNSSSEDSEDGSSASESEAEAEPESETAPETQERQSSLTPGPTTDNGTRNSKEASETTNFDNSSKIMLKAAFIRKLVRDDRRARKALSTGENQSSEKIAAKIRRTIQSNNPKDILSPKSTTPSICETISSPPSSAKSNISQSVRMSIACPKGKGKSDAPKLMVFPRSTAIEEIITKSRAKFGVGSKFNGLKIVSSGLFLDEFELMSLPDGEILHLVAEEKKIIKAPAPVQSTSLAPAAPLSKPTSGGISSTGSVPAGTAVDEVKIESEEEEDWIAPSFPTEISKSELRPIDPNPQLSETLCQLYQKRLTHPQYETIQYQRQQLPIYHHRQQILDLLASNQVLVISGETGSGKTTQVPHYILEDMISKGKGSECNIVCTQPRRIAAISVAERVHYESCEDQVSLGNGLTGYQIRLDSRSSNQTRLLYCTTGVLLRKLQHPEYLYHVSHIIIDEIHERGVETDFLMTILKQQLFKFPHLKLILMSATLQEKKFQQYFYNCPIVYVSGRMFPVTIRYLKEIHGLLKLKRLNQNDETVVIDPKFDAGLVSDLLAFIVTRSSLPSNDNSEINTAKGVSRGEAVLVFLSGIQQIEQLRKVIYQNNKLKLKNIQILILHGSLPPEQQRKVFRPTAPGEWKIILCTNIAETSITVDDVTHVIDCGFMKEQRFHPVSGMSALQEIFLSRSNAAQRSGRAGRVKPGICWRMYDRLYFESKEVEEYPIPEIKRIPLEEIILQIIYLKLGKPEQFLSLCLESPSLQQIRAALANLIEIKAILPKSDLPLTALGFHLAKMPVDIRIGKMLIYGCLLECIEPVLTIASSLSCKNPFVSPADKREEARRIHLRFVPQSDHIAIVNAFNEWYSVYLTDGKQKANDYSRRNFLSNTVLLEIKATRDYYRNHLINAGFHSKTADSSIIKNIESGLTGEREEEVGDVYAEEEEIEEAEEVLLAQKRSSEAAASVDTASIINESIHDILARCALTAGLFPNIIRGIRIPHPEKEFTIKFIQSDQQAVSIHPSSLLSSRVYSLIDEHRQDAFFIYHMKSAVNDRIQVFDLSKIPHLVLLLFSNNEITLSNPGKKHSRKCKRIILKGWIEMEITELQLAIFRLLQKEMEKLLILHVEKTFAPHSSSLPLLLLSERTNREKLYEDYEQEIEKYKHLVVQTIMILMKNA